VRKHVTFLSYFTEQVNLSITRPSHIRILHCSRLGRLWSCHRIRQNMTPADEAASLIVGVEVWSLTMTEEHNLTFRYVALRWRGVWSKGDRVVYRIESHVGLWMIGVNPPSAIIRLIFYWVGHNICKRCLGNWEGDAYGTSVCNDFEGEHRWSFRIILKWLWENLMKDCDL
jgi:hypothetical protein